MADEIEELLRMLGKNDSLSKLGNRDITYKIHVISNFGGKFEERLMGTRIRCARDRFRMDVIAPSANGTLGEVVSGVYYPQEVVAKKDEGEWVTEPTKYYEEKNTAAPFVQAKMARQFIDAEKGKIKVVRSNAGLIGRKCAIFSVIFDANEVDRVRLARLGISLEGSSEMPGKLEYCFDEATGILLAWTLSVEATKKGFLGLGGRTVKVVLREEATKYVAEPEFSREVFDPKKFARTR